MTVESVVWDEWYPVAIAEDVTPCKVYKTRLLDTRSNMHAMLPAG